MPANVAVQSYCYRDFKALPELIAQIKATGLDATELCAVHANFADVSTHAATIDAFRKGGVRIVAIGVEGMTGDAEKDRPRFEFCRAAGAANLSISFGPELLDDNLAGLQRLDAIAGEYGVKVGIHNHGGYDWLGSDRILKWIFSKTKNIGLHMDTAWAIDAKQDPTAWVEKFADRLYGVHVKDFLYNERRQWRDVVIGDGILDLPKFLAALDKASFAGPLVIEYEGDAANPVPALRECVAKLKGERQSA
jgi:inosose dehydratase